MIPSGDVTAILIEASEKTPGAFDRLFALLYDDLRQIAAARMRQEDAGHTLQATALVHEAYSRLVDQTRCQWRNRAHFLAVASQAMRRILVDHARSRGRKKRGGGWEKVSLDEALELGAADSDPALLALDESLRRFEQSHPDKARVVEMRFFGGLTHEECAEVLDLSPRTVARYWEFAQAWLHRDMTSRRGVE